MNKDKNWGDGKRREDGERKAGKRGEGKVKGKRRKCFRGRVMNEESVSSRERVYGRK